MKGEVVDRNPGAVSSTMDSTGIDDGYHPKHAKSNITFQQDTQEYNQLTHST